MSRKRQSRKKEKNGQGPSFASRKPSETKSTQADREEWREKLMRFIVASKTDVGTKNETDFHLRVHDQPAISGWEMMDRLFYGVPGDGLPLALKGPHYVAGIRTRRTLFADALRDIWSLFTTHPQYQNGDNPILGLFWRGGFHPLWFQNRSGLLTPTVNSPVILTPEEEETMWEELMELWVNLTGGIPDVHSTDDFPYSFKEPTKFYA